VAFGVGPDLYAMDTPFTPQEQRECEIALAYIDDMAAWYDEESEDGSKLDFALRILDQIDRRGRLSPGMHSWCAECVREKYSSQPG
jgi:hypothetical protein